MSISPYTSTPLASKADPLTSTSQSQSRSARLSLILCGVTLLVALEGCMKIDQEIDRATSMMGETADSDRFDMEVTETDVTEPDVTEPDVTEPDVTEPDVTEPEMTEMTEPTPVSICAPQPTLYRNRWSIAPQLKTWVDELSEQPCSLASQALETSITQLRGPARFGDLGTESCNDDGCWETLPSTTRTWYESPDDRRGFLDSGEVWVGVIDARRHRDHGQVEAYLIASKVGHNALREIERTWDSDGHILRDRHSFNRQLWSDVTYVWSGDQITQIDFRDHINGSPGYHFDYSYDDQDRLSIAQVSSGRRSFESRWTYDAQGRPASVLRLISDDDGLQPWLHQMWSYNDRGALSAHINHINPELIMSGMSYQLGRAAVLDSYHPIFTMSQYDWDRQAARVETSSAGEACLMLPSGIEIGYPADAQVYDLGWPAKMRPEGIDIMHGFQRIYRIGMLGWMSHFGAQGEHSPVISYLSLAQQLLAEESSDDHDAQRVIKSVIHYEGLHATSEELSVYSSEQAQIADQAFIVSEGAEPIVISRRQRTWREGQMVRDQIELIDDVVRAFDFTYDEDGRVTERTLRRDEELIARYTWAYHPDSSALPKVCQIARYELGYVNAAITEFWSDVLAPEIDQGLDIDPDRDDEATFDIRAAYASTLEGAASGTCAHYTLSGPQAYTLELSFDAQGRLTRQRGDMALSTFPSDNVAVTYHPLHGQITSMRSLDAEGEPSYGHAYEIDDNGMLIAHSSTRRNAEHPDEVELRHSEEFIYECQ